MVWEKKMVTLFTSWSCGWKKPCTMQLRLVVYLRIYKVLCIPGGKTRRMSSTHSDRQTARLPEVPIFGFPGLAKGDFASCVHIQCLKSAMQNPIEPACTWYTWFGERSCVLKNFMPVWKTSAKTSVQVVFFFNMQQNRIHNGGFTVHIWRKLHTFIGSWKAVGTVCAFSPLARPLATPRVVSQIDCKEPGATNRGWGRIWPRKPREHRTFSTLEATIQIIKWTSTFWYFLGFDSIEKNFCPTLFLGIHLIIEKKTTGKNPSLAAQLVADFSIHAGIITKNSFNPSEKY